MARLLTALAVVAFVLVPTSTSAQSSCGFQLGFKAIADQIGTEVGSCLEDEHFNPANGNAEQRTTARGAGGLLVWRKADNWTAYTDGYWTWVNGPNGLQKRLNTERFPFEAAAPAPATSAPPVAPAAPAGPPRAEVPGVALTLNGVTRVARVDQFTAAKPGNTILLADVTIENTGQVPVPYNPLFFRVKDADGYEYNSTIATDQAALKYGEIAPGQRVRGQVATELPQRSTGLVLTFTAPLRGRGFVPLSVAIPA